MKMNKQKMLGATFTTLAALTVSATVFAAINEVSAKEIAEKWVPASAVYVQTKTDNLEYEVEFFNKATNEKYEIEINKLTEMVTEVKTKHSNQCGSHIRNLNENDVKNIVLSEFPGASIQRINLETEDGCQQYDVKFTTSTVRGKMEINPETGIIMERELKY